MIMIIGHISNKAYWDKLPSALAKTLAHLAKAETKALPVGRYEIDGDDIFFMVSEYETKAPSELKAETHSEYIDIQFLAGGAELIGWAEKEAGYPYEYLDEKGNDAVFYASVPNESFVLLKEDCYAVLTENDIHRPCCMVGESAPVKKIVAKVRKTLVL